MERLLPFVARKRGIRHATPLAAYLEAASVFHWATKRHYQLWFTGQTRTRHRRTESVLRKLAVSGRLRAVYYGKQLIYSLPRRSRATKQDAFAGLTKVIHGLACTECLVRFYRSKPDATVIAERNFSGLGAVPEWGILYPSGEMLLFEFCSKSNFLYSGKMIGKLNAYRKNLSRIEQRFGARAIVVFVVDVQRENLDRFVASRLQDQGAFFFADYQTFLQVPLGHALSEPIYTWSYDGRRYALSKDARLENS